MKLVDDAGKAWKWFSMQALALAAAIQTVWISLPPDVQARVPEEWVSYGTVAVLILGGIGRLVKQGEQ